MTTRCPYCDIDVSESSIEAEDGCCPECGSVITARSSFMDDDDDRDFDDDFDGIYGDDLEDEDDDYIDEDSAFDDPFFDDDDEFDEDFDDFKDEDF